MLHTSKLEVLFSWLDSFWSRWELQSLREQAPAYSLHELLKVFPHGYLSTLLVTTMFLLSLTKTQQQHGFASYFISLEPSLTKGILHV